MKLKTLVLAVATVCCSLGAMQVQALQNGKTSGQLQAEEDRSAYERKPFGITAKSQDAENCLRTMEGGGYGQEAFSADPASADYRCYAWYMEQKRGGMFAAQIPMIEGEFLDWQRKFREAKAKVAEVDTVAGYFAEVDARAAVDSVRAVRAARDAKTLKRYISAVNGPRQISDRRMEGGSARDQALARASGDAINAKFLADWDALRAAAEAVTPAISRDELFALRMQTDNGKLPTFAPDWQATLRALAAGQLASVVEGPTDKPEIVIIGDAAMPKTQLAVAAHRQLARSGQIQLRFVPFALIPEHVAQNAAVLVPGAPFDLLSNYRESDKGLPGVDDAGAVAQVGANQAVLAAAGVVAVPLLVNPNLSGKTQVQVGLSAVEEVKVNDRRWVQPRTKPFTTDFWARVGVKPSPEHMRVQEYEPLHNAKLIAAPFAGLAEGLSGPERYRLVQRGFLAAPKGPKEEVKPRLNLIDRIEGRY